MSHYPWAWTTPNAGAFNLADTGAYRRGALVFRDTGTPHPNAGPHDWVAPSARPPRRTAARSAPATGARRARRCCARPRASSGATRARSARAPAASFATAIRVPAGGEQTLWVAVAGSDQGAPRRATAAARRARRPGARRSPAKQASRERLARYSQVSLPGDRRLAEGHRLGQAEHPRPHPARGRPADPRRRRGQGRTRRRSAPWRSVALDRRRLSRLPVDLRHRRRVHGVRVGGRRPVRGDQGPRPRAARRVGDPQRRLRQGRARGRRGRLGVLRQPAARRQHRRDREVPEPRRAPLALDRRRRVPRRPLSLRRAQHALRRRRSSTPTATAGRRGSATSSARAWATRSSTTPSTRSAACTTSPTWRAPPRDAAPYAWAREHGARSALGASRPPGGTRRRRSTPTRSTTPATCSPSRSTGSADPDGGRAHARRAALGPGWRRSAHGVAALEGREDPCYSGTRAVQPRPVPHGLRRRPEGAGERTIFGLNTAIQAVGEGNYGRLGPDEQKRYTDAEVEPMFAEPYSGGDEVHHTPGHARRAARRLAGDLPVAGLRPGRPARRERRALHALPLDGHAGLEPVRDDLAGHAPAARRAAGPRPRRARGRAAAAVARASIAGREHPPRRRRAAQRRGVARRQPLRHRGRHRQRAAAAPDDRAHAAARRAPGRRPARRPASPRPGAPDQPRRRGHGEDPAGRARPRGRRRAEGGDSRRPGQAAPQTARMRLLRGLCSTSARPSSSISGGMYMPKRPR